MQLLTSTFLLNIILVALEGSISENKMVALASLALQSSKKLF